MWYLPLNADDPQYISKALMVTKTGCLSKVFNLTDAHTVKFLVPFTNPTNFIDLTSPSNTPMGKFFVNVYAPLAVGRVQLTLFARFVNAEIAVPTKRAPAVAPVTRFKLQHSRGNGLVAQMATEAEATIGAGVFTGFKGKVKPSKILETTSTVLDAIGVAFPPARIVAMPVSWISTAFSRVFALFGWSKPLSVENVTKVRVKTNAHMQNYNGLDTSENMGLDADNTIGQFPLFGTDLDEMAFDNLISIFNYGSFFEWSTADEVGAELLKAYVHPGVFDQYFNLLAPSGGYQSAQFGYLSFVSKFFSYWAGDIDFQFRAFKTNYHSGRLRITWVPGGFLQGTEFAASDNMAYSVVWDLQTQHTTVVTIPYLSNMPWLVSANAITASRAAHPDDYLNNCVNGHISVTVLNRLVATSSVPQVFRINVETAGRKGFRFAAPTNPGVQPAQTVDAIKWAPQTTVVTLAENVDETLVAQLGDDSGLGDSEKYITQFKPPSAQLINELCTVGEVVTSFRSLLKRFSFYPIVNTDAAPPYLRNTRLVKMVLGPESNNCTDLVVDPFVFAIPPYQISNDGTFAVEYNTYHMDLVATVASLYAYFRGSMRMKFRQSLATTNRTFLTAKVIPTTSYEPTTTNVTQSLSYNSGTALIYMNLEGISEFQIPYYSRTSHTLIKETSRPGTYTGSALPYLRISSNTTVPDFSMLYFRALGDDASFGFLTGVPMMQVMPLNGTAFAP